MKVRVVFMRLLAIVVLIGTIYSGRASSVTFEAESGVLGTGFTDGTDGVVQFASIPRPQGIQWFCPVIVRGKTGQPGRIQLTAKADGLKLGTAPIKTSLPAN